MKRTQKSESTSPPFYSHFILNATTYLDKNVCLFCYYLLLKMEAKYV